jgi:DNA-binding CsgD family transcriptional regulator
MTGLAHFSQFISFSIGLLAIYIIYQLIKQGNVKILQKYFLFIVGVNLIVFVHVLEAFLKILFENDFYNSNVRIIFIWSSLPLALVRLYMAALIISFCRELIGKSNRKIFTKSAFILYPLFLAWALYLFLSPKDLSLQGDYTLWSIHFILFISIVIGSIILYRNANKIEYPKGIVILATFLLVYALGYIISRTINTRMITVSEHTQMFYLGVWALLFNAFNATALKKMFTKQSPISLNNEENLDALYLKYGITNREKEIIKLICEGKTNKEIGELLFIAPVTVRDHNTNIFRKTNVTNRTQLAGLFQAYY